MKEVKTNAYAYPEGDARRNKYTIAYFYDKLNRVQTLARVNNDKNVTLQYTYDAFNNILSKSVANTGDSVSYS